MPRQLQQGQLLKKGQWVIKAEYSQQYVPALV